MQVQRLSTEEADGTAELDVRLRNNHYEITNGDIG
jgi:hypothetical protein